MRQHIVYTMYNTHFHTYSYGANPFFFVYCSAIFDTQVSGYICTFGNDKADEESFDFSSALLMAILIYSLCKSIRVRCAR